MKNLIDILDLNNQPNLIKELMIDKEIREVGHTWKSLSELLGENPSNFKRKLIQNIEKINNWIKPLGLKIKIVNEKD